MRIALLSDVHANLEALESVLAAIADLPPVDAWWHLGDLVGYGPEPDAVVARLAELGAVGEMGNHDAVAAGVAGADWFNPEARVAIEWTRDRIAPATREWLAGLPERLVQDEFTLVHGSPRDPIWEYVESDRIAAAGIAAMSTRHGLHGHTHVPAAFRERAEAPGSISGTRPGHGTVVRLDEGRLLLNPGSVGQPRDLDPRASFAILDLTERTATWHRVAYPIERTQEKMRALGLPRRLVERLVHGT